MSPDYKIVISFNNNYPDMGYGNLSVMFAVHSPARFRLHVSADCCREFSFGMLASWCVCASSLTKGGVLV